MTKLRIAVQKSGRLHEDSMALLKECGISLLKSNRKLKTEAANFPLEVFFLRDDDIPQYVAEGVADIGIVGENVLLETKADVSIAERLGFGKCRLSIAVPRGSGITAMEDLAGKRIATTYANVLGNYLQEKGIHAEIHEISGSVEIAPNIGLAEAICDIVSTGSTLVANGLQEMQVIMRSEAVLIADKEITATRQQLLEQLQFRIQSVQRSKQHKYILLNAPNDKVDEICRLLPGMKSPTVMPLATKGWSSIHTVLPEDDFWNIIEQMRALGAEGILVVPIEKMIV